MYMKLQTNPDSYFILFIYHIYDHVNRRDVKKNMKDVTWNYEKRESKCG